MAGTSFPRGAATAAVVAALVLTGCSQASRTPNTSGSTSAGTTGAKPTSSAPTTPTASPRPTALASPTLGGQCDDLLPLNVVDQALGRPIIGTTSFIRGIAEPNIGRLTYLNCRYGLAKPVRGKPAPAPQVEIGVSLYKSVAQAAARVQGTIQDYRSHGAAQQDTTVGQTPATILLGYGAPTIVAAAGPRTVAITMNAKLIAAAPAAGLTAVANAVLLATANFDGVPGVTATPSPTATGTDGTTPEPTESGASPSVSPS